MTKKFIRTIVSVSLGISLALSCYSGKAVNAALSGGDLNGVFAQSAYANGSSPFSQSAGISRTNSFPQRLAVNNENPFSQTLSANITNSFSQTLDVNRANPFSQMVDALEPASLFIEQDGEIASVPTDAETFNLEQYGTLTAKKTDRFIVKYKAGEEASFNSKTTSLIKNVLNPGADLREFVGQEGSITDSKEALGQENPEICESKFSVLILEEKVLPSEFAETLRSLGAESDIEYIQPDYKLSIESLNDGILEETISETTEEETIDEQSGEKETTEEKPINIEEVDINNSVIVAVIDTGMDVYHNDLVDYVDFDNMWDFVENTNEVYSSENPYEYAQIGRAHV